MNSFRITAAAELAAVREIRRHLLSALDSLPLCPRTMNDIVLSVSELATNVVRHGYPVARSLTVEAEMEDNRLRISIEDDGGPFIGFGEMCQRVRGREMKELGESGLGLALVLATMDDLRYSPGPPNRMDVIVPLCSSAR